MLTRREAARLAHVSYNGIRGWERAGRVTPVRVMNGGVEEIRIPRHQIEEIMRERAEDVLGAEGNLEGLRAEVRLLREEVANLRGERDRLTEQSRVEHDRYYALLEKFLGRMVVSS